MFVCLALQSLVVHYYDLCERCHPRCCTLQVSVSRCDADSTEDGDQLPVGLTNLEWEGSSAGGGEVRPEVCFLCGGVDHATPVVRFL